MKIAFIGQKGIPARSGGVEHHVQELAVRLAKLGHSVTVYARNSYTHEQTRTYRNVRIVHLPSIATKHLDAITHTFLATFHALFSGFDVVHYQSIGPSSLSWLMRLLRPDINVVSTFHCKDYEHQKWGWLARLYLRFGEFITCAVPHSVIVINQELKHYVKEIYGVNATYIPNGSVVCYRPNQKSLSKWQLRPNNYALAVSRLIRHKGIHTLIQAFNILKDAGKLPKDFKLVIVGEGAYTNAYVKELHELAKNNKTIVFTKEQTARALQELFSHARMFVQPSVSEGLSLALLEAMGYGLPIVISDIIENKEAVGETALAFKTQDAADLAAKLSWLLSHPKEAKALGNAAKFRAKTYFNWDAIARQVLEVYERSLSLRNLQQTTHN